MHQMKRNQWLEELTKMDIDGFFTFDNNLLMYKVYNQLKKFYDEEGIPRPYTMFLNERIRDHYSPDKLYLDKVFYTSPNSTVSFYGQSFPGYYVGIQGLYNVFEYLLSQDPEFHDLIHADKMYIPTQVMKTIADEMVFRLRAKNRESLEIGNCFLIFLIFRSIQNLCFCISWRHS